MVKDIFEFLRQRLIRWLGGYWDNSKDAHLKALLTYLPPEISYEAAKAVTKVQRDPSFKDYHGSNLGRNIKRDEAAEWTKLYLKDKGLEWRDSDVNLACELIYHIRERGR